MFKIINILFFYLSFVACNATFHANSLNETLILSKWQSFKQAHNYRVKSSERELNDYAAFKANFLRVVEHNTGQEKFSFKTNVNQISSLNYDSYVNKYLSQMSADELDKATSAFNAVQLNLPAPSLSLDATTREIPDSFDWRTYGLVSTVKTQSTCGNFLNTLQFTLISFIFIFS